MNTQKTNDRLVRVRPGIAEAAATYVGFDELTYAEDEFAQMLVRNYGPMTIAEIACVSGLSRERVEEIIRLHGGRL